MPTEGLAPLGRNSLDVLGPITKTVRDAAIAYDVISGYGTPAFAGRASQGGYTALLGKQTLDGARIGLFGPGWQTTSLSAAVEQLYATAVGELVALGATIVKEPFAGSPFVNSSLAYSEGFTAAAYDFQNYLQAGLGIASFGEFVDIVGRNPATPDGPLDFILDDVPLGPDGQPDADQVPDLGPFREYQAAYQRNFADVFAKYELDALVFPSIATLQPFITEPGVPDLTASPEINVAGVPVVTVPSTRLPGPPRPFSLAFIGPQYSEPALLALAYDYEQATQLRIVPDLPV